jgi:hypothetical protein
VAVAFFLLILGIPGLMRDRAHMKFAATLYFDALFRPHLVGRLPSYHSTGRLCLFLVTLYLLSLVIFSSFSAILVPLSLGFLGMLVTLLLTMLMNSGGEFRKIFVTVMAPRVIIMSFIAALIAVRGSGYFWYQLWVSDLFRMIFFSIFVMLIFRKFHIYILMGKKLGRRNSAGSAALVFMVFGIQLLVAGVSLQLFGLEESLTALNNELLVLPGGLSKIMGITTHLGIPLQLPVWIILFASILTALSFLLFLFNRKLRY